MKSNTALRSVQTAEERAKSQLQKSIESKRQFLTRWITKNEMLRVELEMVKQEYDVRVGSLYLKDNQLDLEIIKYRNIKSLMEKGSTFEDAVQTLQNTYYAEELEMEKEQEKMRFEQLIYEKREAVQDESVIKNIKSLWKKLITKYHADLVQDSSEKEKREKIMKQINLAYEEQDLDKLQRIERDEYSIFPAERTVEKLEEILVQIENDIIKQIHEYHEQRMSEWYSWKKRIAQAKKQNRDVFKDIERKLLDDIIRKYELVNSLKQETSVT